MSEAILQDVTGGIDVSWPDNPFIIHVRRLHTHTDGRVTGFITIIVKDKKKDKVVYPSTQINFAADRTRGSLAKELTAKNPSFPWGDMVDQLCQLVPEKALSGEPSQEMWAGLDNSTVIPPKYQLEPFILENLPNVIFGEPGSAKTTLALAFVSIMLHQIYDNNLNIIPNNHEVRSLYLDWESDFSTIQWQLHRLQKGMGWPPVGLSYRKCNLPLAQDVEQIRNHIEQVKANLIIIDSMGLASGGELNSSESPIALYTAIRQLNITSLLLGHTNKNKEEKSKSIYGNQYFTAQARNAWEVRKVTEDDEDNISLALYHTKPPPFGKKRKPMGFHIHFDDQENTARITSQDPKSVPEFVERMGNNTRILNILKDGALEPKEMAEILSINPASVRTSLKRLTAKNLVVKVGDKYGLLSKF